LCGVSRKKFARNAGEARKFQILVGYQRARNTPIYRKLRIAPQDSVFVRGVVKVAALIEELDRVAQRKEAMGKTRRYINEVLFLGGKKDARPFSEPGGTETYVDGNIERLALYDAAKLGLRMLELIVKTAKRALGRGGMVILNETVRNSESGEPGAMIRLHEKAARVAKNPRPELTDARDRCFHSLQRNQFLALA
jgi:hypothetical protein